MAASNGFFMGRALLVLPLAPPPRPLLPTPPAAGVKNGGTSPRFARLGVPSCNDDDAAEPPGALAEATAPVPYQPPGPVRLLKGAAGVDGDGRRG